MQARGEFEVKLATLPAYSGDSDVQFGRMPLDKIFRGDLQAASKGEMLMATGEDAAPGQVSLYQPVRRASPRRPGSAERVGRGTTRTLPFQHAAPFARRAPATTTWPARWRWRCTIACSQCVG